MLFCLERLNLESMCRAQSLSGSETRRGLLDRESLCRVLSWSEKSSSSLALLISLSSLESL